MSLPHPEDDPSFYDHVIAKRFLAWCVDLVVTLVLVLVPLILSAFLLIFVFPVLWSAVAVAYRTVMITRYGATAGMMVASVKLRGLDAARPDAATAFWHSVIYAASMVFMFPQIASVGMMLTTPYKQGLNDWVLGTTIVNRFVER